MPLILKLQRCSRIICNVRFDPEHVHRLEFLPALDNHLDPFDRMLLAQAQCEDLVLLTHDQKFIDYNDPRVQVL